MTVASTAAASGQDVRRRQKTASYDSALYKLLEKRLPTYVRRGRLDVRAIAKTIEKSPAAVYNWLQENKISSAGAASLIDISDGRLTAQDLAEHLI